MWLDLINHHSYVQLHSGYDLQLHTFRQENLKEFQEKANIPAEPNSPETLTSISTSFSQILEMAILY